MNELARTVGPFWSIDRVQAALGLPDPSAVLELFVNHKLLGVPLADGTLVFPISQFRRRADATETLPEFCRALEILKSVDPWTTALIMASSWPELNGLRPVEWAGERGFDSTLERCLTRLAAELAR